MYNRAMKKNFINFWRVRRSLGYIFLLMVLPIHSAQGAFPEWVTEVEEALEKHLQGPEGLYHTNTSDPSYLSETLTLRMELALLRKDKEKFDLLCGYMRKYFLSPLGLLYWKLDFLGKPVEFSNASIDDLRALRVLKKAFSLWEDEKYRNLYALLQDGLFLYNVRDGRLLNGCSWEKRGLLQVYRTFPLSDEFTLSYGDLETLRALGLEDPRWLPVYMGTLGIMSGGLSLGKGTPWTFNIPSEVFSWDKENPINSLIYILSLLRVGFLPREALDTYREEFRSFGSIRDSRGSENIAVYALFSLALNEAGYPQESRRVLDRLESFLLTFQGYEGLLGYLREDEEGISCQAWVFDNLLALIAAFSAELP